MPIRAACTECGKKLSVRDELAGKKVKCPGCASVFTAQAKQAETAVQTKPPRPGAGTPAKDKVSAKPPPKRPARPAMDDDDDLDERPVRASRSRDDDEDDDAVSDVRPSRGRGKKKCKPAKAVANRAVLWIALAGLLMVLSGIGSYFLFFRGPTGAGAGAVAQGNQAGDGGRKIGGQPSAVNFVAMVPGDAFIFASIVMDFNKASSWEPNQIRAMDAIVQKSTGIPLTDFERASVFTVVGFDEAKAASTSPFVFLVQTRKPVNRVAVQGSEALKTLNATVEFLDDQTMLVGAPAMLQTYKNRLGKTKAGVLARALDRAAKMTGQRGGFVLAVAIPPELVQMAQAGQKNAPPWFPLVEPFLKAKSILLTGEDRESSGSLVELSIALSDPSAAKQAEKAAQDLIGMAKGQVAAVPKDPQLQQAVQLANLALKELKITVQGNDLNLSVHLDAKVLEGMMVQALEATAKVQGAVAANAELNNLRQIGLAWHGYLDRSKTFPPQSSGKGLSWRVMILPYLDENALFNKFKLDEPWDSPHNKQLIPLMPKVFRSTSRQCPPGQTFYQAFVGPNTINPVPTKGATITTMRDGTSNIVIVAEAETPVEWTRPADITVSPNVPIRLGASSPNGSLAGFADGSVRYLPTGIDQQILRWLIDPADGNPIPKF